jgi:hypothetical protein
MGQSTGQWLSYLWPLAEVVNVRSEDFGEIACVSPCRAEERSRSLIQIRYVNNVTRPPASPIWERGAALTSRLQSLETELLTQADSRYRRLSPLTADMGGWYSVGFSSSPN